MYLIRKDSERDPEVMKEYFLNERLDYERAVNNAKQKLQEVDDLIESIDTKDINSIRYYGYGI